MSSIYFHSPSGDAKVSGAERSHAGILCTDLLCAALGMVMIPDVKEYRPLLPPGAYPLSHQDSLQFFQAFRLYLNGLMGDTFLVMPLTGEKINTFYAALNTAVAGGSDPIRLLAKLHGQCEIHCYVEGENRAWLAGIIEQGIRDRILRTWEQEGAEYGWQSVVDLLKKRDDEPVVCSYSVTDQFPNRYTALEHGGWSLSIDHEVIRRKYELEADDDPAEWESDYTSEVWYDLSTEEQWQYAMAGLRKANEKGHLEMRPDNLGTQGYGNGLSGFDIYVALYDRK